MPTQEPNNAADPAASDAQEADTAARVLTAPQDDQAPGGGTLSAASAQDSPTDGHGGTAPNAPFTAPTLHAANADAAAETRAATVDDVGDQQTHGAR